MNFEICETQGLARKGKLRTSHGTINTPVIFPVHDLGTASGGHTPEYWKRFPRINTAMFNASLLKMDVDKQLEVIVQKGIHKFVNFSGVAFVDSGGWIYNKHSLKYTQRDILEIQERIGADIASTLDYPIRLVNELNNQNITISIHNAIWAAKNKKKDEMLLFASVHGSDPIILRNVIRYLNKKADFDGFAIGSLLPIHSNYQLLIDIIIAARKEIPAKPLHVYGLAGPIILGLLTFLGVDTMDSSTFVMAASRKAYFMPNFKRIPIRNIHLFNTTKVKSSLLSSISIQKCCCSICAVYTVEDLMNSRELLSFHNLLESWNQIQEFNLALSEKRLDQYIQRRFYKIPWASKAFEYAKHRMRFGRVN